MRASIIDNETNVNYQPIGLREMTITVRYFAALRERMGRAEERLDCGPQATVAAIWDRVSGGEPLPPNVLAAVNHEYVGAAHPVHDGDEVAFFPPVTGGRGDDHSLGPSQ